jgi:hypothetical protein
MGTFILDWKRFKRDDKKDNGIYRTLECQHTTRGHKTLGDKWLFEPRFSHQKSLYRDSEVAPNSPTFDTANR